MLIGHHGFFSLTPIFLLAAAAMVVRLTRRLEIKSALANVQFLTAAVSIVVFVFYIGFAAVRNYGGWTSGLRWLIWVSPLWLVCLLPAADWLGRRSWGRGVAYVALLVSIVSASYPAWTPWHHPWLYDLLEWQGRLKY